MRLKHGVEAIDMEAAAALIAEVAEAIQPRCWEFLEDALDQIGGTLQGEGWLP